VGLVATLNREEGSICIRRVLLEETCDELEVRRRLALAIELA
jgi:hypothetical protein